MSTIVTGGKKGKSGSDKIKGDDEPHELVKIMAQVTKDVTRPASNKFETILVNFDKINTIRNERELTEPEQRIYDKVHRYVDREFGAMFKRADPMINELRKRASVQRGGQEGKDGKDGKQPPAAAAGNTEPVSEHDVTVEEVDDNADADAKGTKGEQGPPKTQTVNAKTDPPADNATTKNNAPTPPPAKESSGTDGTNGPESLAAGETVGDGNEVKLKNDSTNDTKTKNNAVVPKVQGAVIETQTSQPQDAGTQAAEKKTAETQTKKGTPWAENFRFLIWIWDGIKAIFNKIISFFTASVDDKMRELMVYFSVDHLMGMLGNDLTRVKSFGAELESQIKNLQRTVVTGISGAATASIDMILNAFSMMPVIGTTILVWRMFQNMLVIIGATLSVQAGKQAASGAVSGASGTSPADAKAANNEIRELNPGDGGEAKIKRANQTVDDRGKATVGGGKRAPLMHQMQPSKTLKKSAKNFKRSLKRFVQMRPALLIPRGGGGVGLSSAKRELTKGSKYATASGLFSGYAAL